MAIPDEIPDLAERLNAMLLQETRDYQRIDYLTGPQRCPNASSNAQPLLSSESVCASSTSSHSSVIDERWREKICEWSYQVVDHFDFDRETVSISLSYLDRFLSTRKVSQKVFQLAAMTTLYIATKLFEPRNLSMSSLLKLARGHFTAKHITAMERTILKDLSWRVHPPTPQSIARHLITLMPSETDEDLKFKQDVIDLSHFLIELSVCDYFFVTRKSSSIAMAAVLQAMDCLNVSTSVSDNSSALLFRKMSYIDRVREVFPEWGIEQLELEMSECIVRLNDMCDLQSELGKRQPRQIRVETVSPVCVSGAPHGLERVGNDFERVRKARKTRAQLSPAPGGVNVCTCY